MKYLRRFNENVSSEIDDILLELNDIGFKTNNLENLELGEYFISIDNDSNDYFKFSDISDSILRLVDYLSDNSLYLQSINIDNVMLRTQPNSYFDNRHPDKVINDISNDNLSQYYPDRGGIPSIRPDKVNHIQLYFRK